MTTQAPPSRRLRARFVRKQALKERSPSVTEVRRIDRPYDLTGDGYRVVLGCCSQTNLTSSVDSGRPASAKLEPITAVKEVKS